MNTQNGGRSFGLIYEDKPEEFWLENTDYKPVVGSTIRVDEVNYSVEKIEDGDLYLTPSEADKRERENSLRSH